MKLDFLKNLPRGTLVLIVTLFTLLLMIFYLSITSKRSGTPVEPTPIPQSDLISPLQKSVVLKTTRQDLETKYKEVEKTASKSGDIYSFPSSNPLRADTILVKDNVVIFERISLPEKSSDPGYSTFTETKEKFGVPEKLIKGSFFYGPLISTHIYASKGIVFIGNDYTDEVYEIQQFKPTSVQEYLKLYGQDINESEPPKEFP